MPDVLSSPSPQTIQTRGARMAVRGLRSVLFGVAIAVFLSMGASMALWPTLVHSVLTSTLCWFAIDLGRIPLARWAHRNDPPGSSEAASHWPGWKLMSIAVVIGTIFGFSVGNNLAGLLLGEPLPGYFRGTWSQALGLLAASLVPAVAVTYWFYSRETIAGKEAALLAAQRQAAEHQLKLLESQLEPHMLFNTLANLRVLIGIDPPRAQAMLDQLIAFLRATLSGSRASQHPLSAEFARLGDYLALMQIRMGERLRPHFELPPALVELPVPPLLLQPLVENAIKHGLEPAVDGGRIDIAAAREGDMLVLTVRDTGAGLTAEAGDGTRFGLVQVRERLATFYGARATLTLASAHDDEGGTLATIRLPLPVASSTTPSMPAR